MALNVDSSTNPLPTPVPAAPLPPAVAQGLVRIPTDNLVLRNGPARIPTVPIASAPTLMSKAKVVLSGTFAALGFGGLAAAWFLALGPLAMGGAALVAAFGAFNMLREFFKARR